MDELLFSLCRGNVICNGLVGGFFIALLNTLGAMIVLIIGRVPQKFMDASLGFAAGVMLAASFTSLIIPGVEIGGIYPVIIGILLGAIFIDLLDHLIPHMHFIIGTEGIKDEGLLKRIRSVWLFILAITIHNMPEGLAVGVGFGSGDLSEAIPLMIAIGLQNIPEGLAVSLAAINAGFGRRFYAAWVGIRAGLVEIPLALLGAWAVYVMKPLLPYAMGFAAGAMIYVISDEIVPETHRAGHERLATFGLILGLVLMLYLDIILAG